MKSEYNIYEYRGKLIASFETDEQYCKWIKENLNPGRVLVIEHLYREEYVGDVHPEWLENSK